MNGVNRLVLVEVVKPITRRPFLCNNDEFKSRTMHKHTAPASQRHRGMLCATRCALVVSILVEW